MRLTLAFKCLEPLRYMERNMSFYIGGSNLFVDGLEEFQFFLEGLSSILRVYVQQCFVVQVLQNQIIRRM